MAIQLILVKTEGTGTPPAATNWFTAFDAGTADYNTDNGVPVLANGNIVVGVSDNASRGGMISVDPSTSAQAWQIEESGTAQFETIRPVGSDSSGNVYAIGSLGSGGVYLMKFTSTGTLTWARYLVGLHVQYDASVTAAGDVVVCGVAIGETPDIGFIAKWNTSGTLQWQKNVATGSNVNHLKSVAIDDSGNIYVAGDETVGSTPLVLKLTSAGASVWQRKIPTGLSATATTRIVLDAGGAILFTVRSNAGSFVVKLSSADGTITWERKITTSFSRAEGVVSDSSNNVYVVGSRGDNGTFIIKYNSSGVLQWQNKLSTNISGNTIKAAGVTVDGTDILVNGSMMTDYVNPGSFDLDVYLARLPMDGTKTGVYSVVSGNTVNVTYAAGSETEEAGTLDTGDAPITPSVSTSSYTEQAATIAFASASTFAIATTTV